MKITTRLQVILSSLIVVNVSSAGNMKAAPGKGIIPSAYIHYKTEPSFYNFQEMPIEHIMKGVGRRFVYGTQSTLVQWTLDKNTRLPLHYHQHEQINSVSKGKIKIYSQGKEYTLKPGQIMVFPPYVPHEFIALKDSILIGQVTPVRQDFLPKLAGIPNASLSNKLLEAKDDA